MMRVLVSVRSVDEARVAAAAGVDFIDLKEPSLGALGGLPTATLEAVVRALRPAGGGPATAPATGVPMISATIGDLPTREIDAVLGRVGEVAACGVDLVKVGIERDAAAPALLRALAAAGPAIVPVFIADDGIDPAAFAQAASLDFPALMLDTAAKRAGSLFDLLEANVLAALQATARAAGRPLGLAGALQLADLPRLSAAAPAFAGFRSAVCAGDRRGPLDAARLQSLLAAVRSAVPAAPLDGLRANPEPPPGAARDDRALPLHS